LQQVIANHPGTHSVTGKVTTSQGAPIVGALLQSGATHFTYTDANGNYVLAGLINSSRTITVSASGYTFSTPSQSVTLAGADVPNINFQSQ
jgi:hypothetical protein